MSGIYSFAASEEHTFDLYHRTNGGKAIATGNGSMVVVGLDVAGTTLAYGTAQQSVGTVTSTGPTPYMSQTTSTAWSYVEQSSSVDLGASIDISDQGGKVFVACSLNSDQTTDADTVSGEWQLVLCNSGGTIVETLGTTVQRTISNSVKDSAGVMLYAMTSDLDSGEYTVKLQQKVASAETEGDGIQTFNASINAIGLTIQDGDSAGEYFEGFGVTGTEESNAGATLEAALTQQGLTTTDGGIVAAAYFTSFRIWGWTPVTW